MRTTTTLFGVVPNFSEGRRTDVIDAIVQALHVPGARVVYAEADPDHNRLDTTVLGGADAVRASAMAGAAVAVDAHRHAGAHGRASAHGRRRRDPVHAGARRHDRATASSSRAGSGASSPSGSTCPCTSTIAPRCCPSARRWPTCAGVSSRGCARRSRAGSGFPTSGRTRIGPAGATAVGAREAARRVQRLPRRHRRGGREGDREGSSGRRAAGCRPCGRSGSRCRSEAASSRSR